VLKPKHALSLRNGLPLILWALALAISLNSGWVIAYRFLYLFTLLIITSLVWSQGTVQAIQVERAVTRQSLHVGDTLIEKLTIRNRSPLPQMWVAVADASTLPLHLVRQVITYLRPRSSRQLLVRTLCLRRGRYRLGPALLISGDPFGIFRAQREVPAASTVVIYPRLFRMPSLDLVSAFVELEAQRARRTASAGPQVTTVREYLPGDELSRIHWRSTAKHGRLMSKQFEQRPARDVWVVADMHRAVQAGHLLPLEPENGALFSRLSWPPLEPSTEEYVVSIAASVVRHFLEQDRQVGLVAHASHRCFFPPDRGPRQLNRLLEALATIRADGRTPLYRVLQLEASNFKRFDMLVVITPSEDESWIAALHALSLQGVGILPFIVERATFLGAAGSSSLANLLAARRLPCCFVRNGQTPDQASCYMPASS
jgi:uncharacterized protein (DUF58 family)